MKYKYIDIATADAAFQAYGTTLSEAFENAALALENITTDTSKIGTHKKKTIGLEEENLESLLFDFLSEILYLNDFKNIIFSSFDVDIQQNNKYHLQCTCKGQKLDPKKHQIEGEVKAITYNQMSIEKNKKWALQVVVDI